MQRNKKNLRNACIIYYIDKTKIVLEMKKKNSSRNV